MTIRRAELADAAAIADIYNEAILTTTATFDTEPKSVDERGSRESIRLNGSAGFIHVGTLKEVGRKFDRFLSVHIMQKMLD